jgi:hypothetical protein
MNDEGYCDCGGKCAICEGDRKRDLALENSNLRAALMAIVAECGGKIWVSDEQVAMIRPTDLLRVSRDEKAMRVLLELTVSGINYSKGEEER